MPREATCLRKPFHRSLKWDASFTKQLGRALPAADVSYREGFPWVSRTKKGDQIRSR
jgi:hypothetical protein